MISVQHYMLTTKINSNLNIAKFYLKLEFLLGMSLYPSSLTHVSLRTVERRSATVKERRHRRRSRIAASIQVVGYFGPRGDHPSFENRGSILLSSKTLP